MLFDIGDIEKFNREIRVENTREDRLIIHDDDVFGILLRLKRVFSMKKH